MKKPNIQIMSVDDVKPYELNSKVHDDKQVKKIAESIKKFGWDQPIVTDKNGVIIKGHGRRLAAISLGLKTVPVWVRDDLTEDEARASRLADNRVAVGGIDTSLLQQELAALDYDMEGIFDAKELDFLNADLGEIDVSAFVDDMDAELGKQTEETTKKLREMDQRRIKIDKALGFKDIAGADERDVSFFMAAIEVETGKEGAEAFVEFARNYRQPEPKEEKVDE